MAKAEGFKEKGLNSGDKGVYIPPENRMERRPEYLHMSKADMQKDRDARREKANKVKAYAKSLDVKEEPKEEVKEESKVKQVAKKKKA
jgi:hypothetical protein